MVKKENRICKICLRKTVHNKIINKDTFDLVCEVCGKVVTRRTPPRKRVVLSEQYVVVPTVSDEDRACFNIYGGKVYPSCVIHGALLRFEHDIWRCVVCGFAVTWRRKDDQTYKYKS